MSIVGKSYSYMIAKFPLPAANLPMPIRAMADGLSFICG